MVARDKGFVGQYRSTIPRTYLGFVKAMRQNRSGVRRPAERETTRGEGIGSGEIPGWIDGGVLRSGIEGRGWWGKVGEVLREGNTAPQHDL